MHAGHEIVKCECGKVISPCRCTNLCGDRDKPVSIQRPCKCEEPEARFDIGGPPNITLTPKEEEKTLQQKLAQVARDTCRAHKGAGGCCYVVNLAVATAIENYKED